MLRSRARLVALPLLVALVAACSDDDGGGDATTTTSPDRTVVGVVFDVGGVEDGGLNAATQAALDRAEQELGVEVEALEPGPSGEDRAELLDLLAEGDADVVLAVGAGAQDAAEASAGDHPDTPFVLVGGDAPSATNLTSISFREEQAAYLAGAAAALTSTAQHLGVVLGTDDARARALQAGFVAGARRIAEEIPVDVTVVPPAGTGPDLTAAAAAADALREGGADVVLGAPEEVAEAILPTAAASAGGLRVVGVGEDLAATADPALAGAVLTSGLRLAEPAVFEAIEAFTEDRLDPGLRAVGAAETAVGYAPGAGLPPEVTAQLDELLAMLASGEIQVPTEP